MRSFIFVLVLVTLLCVCEAKKHKKKEHHHLKGEEINGVAIKGPSAVPYHKGVNYHKLERLRGQHLFSNKKGRKRGKSGLKWMKLSKKMACKEITCSPKEFCLVNPDKGTEKCINKRDFKEGRRLFKSFYKQSRKMKDTNEIKRLEEIHLSKGEHVEDIFALLNHHHKQKKGKKHHSQRAEKVQDKMFQEAKNEQECRPTEISELKKRMVGWFDMVHTESRSSHHRIKDYRKMKLSKKVKPQFNGMAVGKNVKLREHHHKKQHHKRFRRSVHDEVEKEIHGHCACSKSVMWEFRKQDISEDGHLEEREMTVMKSNRREPCMKPLLKSCDKDGDGKLTRGEWCCCYQETVAPCFEKKHLSHADDWVPRCDAEGYYEREQCHKSGHCWCVDINGNEIQDTKVEGKADCQKYGPNGYLNKQ